MGKVARCELNLNCVLCILVTTQPVLLDNLNLLWIELKLCSLYIGNNEIAAELEIGEVVNWT